MPLRGRPLRNRDWGEALIKEEFYFDSRDGKTRLHAVRWTPDDPASAVCILQIVHGMSEYVERYEEFAGFLTDRGFIVTGEDHLGHGGSVAPGGSQGYFCEQDPATVLVRDVHRLKKMTQARFPGLPYVILGHSMGSFILRNYLCRYGSGISAAVIMGTGMPSRASVGLGKMVAAVQKVVRGSGHVSRLLDRMAFGGYNRRVEKPRTSGDWLSREEERVDKYLEDPMCGAVFTVNGFATLFELVGRLHNPRNLAEIPSGLPIYMVSGTGDPVGDYGKGVEKAYSSLQAAGLKNLELKLYEGARHELLNETNRREVMQDIYAWLERTVLCGGTEQEE